MKTEIKNPLKLVGSVGSPYTRKMRSLMRYRRIPFHFIEAGTEPSRSLPPAPLPLMPVVYYPSEGGYEATSDSTFQLRRLEVEFDGRSVIPSDPAVAFIDYLIEDYADEWVTKMMFHYRWAIQENVDHAVRIMPRWHLGVSEANAGEFATRFGPRQVDRLWVVGSNAITASLIEESYRRLLGLLESLLQAQPFVLGARPGSADFGLLGQLVELVQVEPASQRIAREISYRVLAWCDALEDISGVEVDAGGWPARGDLADRYGALLGEIGQTYAPFLLANAAALDSGAESVECEIMGKAYSQKPFKYQGKCLAWLREAYAALDPSDRAAVDDALAGGGCETLFTA
ncbi:MAG: glutathione S-transferase C-terminal domain-containing protein [Myxococcota bacterium]|nr:glutathione S-transferase C-terminal domain-containing protein [Myxococcota bacterium]